MGRRSSLGAQAGFTLVEVMAAALVLVVGMLAVLTVVQTGQKKTTLNQRRIAGTNLARELTEAARSAAYQDLTPAQAAATIQAADPSVETITPGDWQVRRGSTIYTIKVSACTFDDPADNVAQQAPDNRCADNPTTPTGDSNGDDFRRLTFQVTWDKPGSPGTETFQQSALVVNPAGGIGPRIISFPDAANVGPSDLRAHFDVTTSSAASVHWNADDGVGEGDALRVAGSYTKWSIDWDLKAVNAPDAILDGTYTVTAQALDDLGVAGDTKIATVVVNRSAPFPVAGFKGGHDTRAGDWVDLEWKLNAERDIAGYTVYRDGGDGVIGSADDLVVCPSAGGRLKNDVTTCQDLNPVGASRKYYVRAFDATQSSTPTVITVSGPSAQPPPPSGLSVTGSDAPALTWPAANGAAFYRVYRDGTAIADRVEKTPDLTFTDGVDGQRHDYYVTAVDSNFNESPPVGPVGWSP
jgi:Tfp pilus assembly protein PilV